MNVEYTVLGRSFGMYQKEYEEAALRVLHSGWYILGPEVKKFEEKFAEKMGAKHCIAVNSGTDALILALRALGIGKGDDVLVPAGSYIASVIGVTENGAQPEYVDSDEFMLMDPEKIEERITPRTRAILPVHMYGQACDMEKISEIARKYDLFLIEDCAQSHGAKVGNKYTGTFGKIGCFSFYPTKPLGAMGDGGVLLTDDDKLAEQLRMMRNYGSKVKYHNEIPGINSRMDEMQAAILQVGLKHMEENTKRRLEIADRYCNQICHPEVKLPKVRFREGHVFHLFPVCVENRSEFRDYLLRNGIKTQIHYPIPPYLAECYPLQNYRKEDFPKASYIADHEVSLPIYSGMPMQEVNHVIKTINSYRSGK